MTTTLRSFGMLFELSIIILLPAEKLAIADEHARQNCCLPGEWHNGTCSDPGITTTCFPCQVCQEGFFRTPDSCIGITGPGNCSEHSPECVPSEAPPGSGNIVPFYEFAAPTVSSS